MKVLLERFGLLQSRHEEINDDNLNKIVKYLEHVKKKSKLINSNDVMFPNLRKVSGADSYRITPLGKNYLTMIDR